jgi:hypothetical protein
VSALLCSILFSRAPISAVFILASFVTDAWGFDNGGDSGGGDDWAAELGRSSSSRGALDAAIMDATADGFGFDTNDTSGSDPFADLGSSSAAAPFEVDFSDAFTSSGGGDSFSSGSSGQGDSFDDDEVTGAHSVARSFDDEEVSGAHSVARSFDDEEVTGAHSVARKHPSVYNGCPTGILSHGCAGDVCGQSRLQSWTQWGILWRRWTRPRI